MTLRIATIVGARPQFVKAAVLSRLFEARKDMEEVVIHTGQHFDEAMSQVFFDELGMRAPAHNLGIGGGPHGAQTGRMLEKIEEVLLELRPDGVLVYGDTNSTLAGVLAAVKLHIPVAHVEAGLRSFNQRMPEEVNRVLSDHVCRLLFAPTAEAERNLAREGLPAERVHRVGDVMYDAALYYAARARERSRIIDELGLTVGAYVLATAHRAENVDDLERLSSIVEGLADVAAERTVVFPVHPRTAAALEARPALAEASRSIRWIPPVGYLDMVMLEQSAGVIATDSGGVQKEAFFFRVPCVILRDETEWVELVELGWNRLISPLDRESVCTGVIDAFGRRGRDAEPYGDGRAGERILSVLERAWGAGPVDAASLVPALPGGAAGSRGPISKRVLDSKGTSRE